MDRIDRVKDRIAWQFMVNSPIRVAELFAGVGGFRLGLEGDDFDVIFSNQWEPGEKTQWASKIYEKRFGSKGHFNVDIHTVRKDVPEHDLLVGGFPCQDYSVARTKSGEMGIEGEKGKLWTPIKQIIRDAKVRPKVVLLENVPRLLSSPSNFRGLNFAVICSDLLSMGYDVEWRIINASDYGMPQQRRRVFILAYRRATQSNFYRNGKPNFGPEFRNYNAMSKWLTGIELIRKDNWSVGPLASAFPLEAKLALCKSKFPEISEFNWSLKKSPFMDAGYVWKDNHGGKWMWTFRPTPIREEMMTLRDVLCDEHESSYEIDVARLDEWAYAKSKKNEFRLRKKDWNNVDRDLLERYKECMKAPFGKRREMWMDEDWRDRFKTAVGEDSFYHYDEGTMGFDDLDRPSRTMVTAEIGSTPSRMRHIFEYEKGKFRRLMPIETERLNMFPDNWTLIEGISDSRRGFLMGNALVVGIIERLKIPLLKILKNGK